MDEHLQPPIGEAEPREDDEQALVKHIAGQVERAFPQQYPVINREWFDNYDPGADTTDRGKILMFLDKDIPTPEDFDKAQSLLFIYRPQGFVINYYNSPEPQDVSPQAKIVRNKNNSLYGPLQHRWTNEELDYALQKAHIHMTGIDIHDPHILQQAAGWHDGKPITLGQRMQLYEDYKMAGKKKPQHLKNILTSTKSVFAFTSQNPEAAQALALSRITQDPYILPSGQMYSQESAIAHIQQQTSLGQEIVSGELYRVEAVESLLKNHGLLFK